MGWFGPTGFEVVWGGLGVSTVPKNTCQSLNFTFCHPNAFGFLIFKAKVFVKLLDLDY